MRGLLHGGSQLKVGMGVGARQDLAAGSGRALQQNELPGSTGSIEAEIWPIILHKGVDRVLAAPFPFATADVTSRPPFSSLRRLPTKPTSFILSLAHAPLRPAAIVYLVFRSLFVFSLTHSFRKHRTNVFRVDLRFLSLLSRKAYSIA